MLDILEFWRFDDPNALVVSLGVVLLGCSAAVVGSFAYLRKRSLVGDAIAHAILPGIALSFLIFQQKSPWLLMLGALVSGWLAMLSIEYISQGSKIKPDTSIGLVLSVFFGIGILLLTHIQHHGPASQAGLDQFLFGKAAGMQADEVKAYALVALVLILGIAFFYKELKLLSFNPDFAQSIGLPVRFLRLLLSTLTVLAIATGIQSVGVVLMAALLITPAAAARPWTERLSIMLLLSALFGGFSGLMGAWISYSIPKMPTGPWIVMSLTAIALGSLTFAPRRGLLAKMRQQRANRIKIVSENFLKSLYQLSESHPSEAPIRLEDIRRLRSYSRDDVRLASRRLMRNYWLFPNALRDGYKLTNSGLQEARRVVRLHRLWEMYLSERLRLKADHLHPNAETMEHVITPEIEALLLKELNYPTEDPHNSPIPYGDEQR